MDNFECLDKRYSTARRLFRAEGADMPAPEPGRESKNRGGLRERGFIRKSSPELPLVTVITVVLNDAEGLKKTMASVLGQSYDNIEYIIIDGGSGEPLQQVLRENGEWADLWISEPDKGIYDAMNKGAGLASGAWIIFINAGDYFYETDTVRKVFCKNYDAADFIYGHTFFLGGDFYGVVRAWSFDILWKTMIFTHQSLFTRSEILKRSKFDTRFKICADYNLIYNAYVSGMKFVNSDIVIAAFDPGVSEVSRSRMAYEKWRVVRKHRNDFHFHWFYIKLFFSRFLRDLRKKIGKVKTGKRS